MEAFLIRYEGRLRPDEIKLFSLLGWGHNPWPKRFYVIGSPSDSVGTIHHEISHAFFHIYSEYAHAMTAAQYGYDLRGVHKFLKDNMYSEDMYDDEVTSYVMFDSKMLNRNGVKTRHLNKLRQEMQIIYHHYKQTKITGMPQ